MAGQNTNNFSESNVNLFKSFVLERAKAYNAVSLVEMIVTVYESFYKSKILLLCKSRSSRPKLLLQNLLKRGTNFDKSRISKLSETDYQVKSVYKFL